MSSNFIRSLENDRIPGNRSHLFAHDSLGKRFSSGREAFNLPRVGRGAFRSCRRVEKRRDARERLMAGARG
jgi:hypothetical protein